MHSFYSFSQGAGVQYLLTPYSRHIENYVWWEGAFTEQELNVLQQRAANSTQRGKVGGELSREDLNKIRRSNVTWVDCSPDTEWIFKKLSHVASALNSQFYNLDLTGFGEPLQFTNYDQSDHGMYNWHQDYNAQISRKLSMVLQLTDPSEYEGGNLQIMTGGEVQNVRKQRGLIAAFPSYVLHQVTPITSGSRQSLVCWISGPQFK